MAQFQPMQFQPEFITFGETMGLLRPEGNRAIEYSSRLQNLFGGAESNVAIGVARLGHTSGWFGRLGKDPFGSMILKKIRGEGVDVSRAERTSEASTGLMMREVVAGKTSVYYYRKNSAASLMKPEHLDEEYISRARILHVTGVTPALSASCRETVMEAIRLAHKHGVKVCFDPNLRLKLWTIEEAREVLLEISKEADYFLPGLEELKLLYRTDDFDTIMGHLGRLSAVCVVKGGDEATYLVEKGKVRSIPYFKVDQVVDTVGAGDGFCAGFIAGVLKDLPYAEAVRIGNLVGSMVIQTEGDWEGIPVWEQVENILNETAHVER